MPLWINKGRIFKKFQPSNDCKSSKGTNTNDNKSCHSILEKYEIKECRNNNIVVQSIVREVNLQEITQQNKVLIKENDLLKLRISVIKSKEEAIIENYEVEKMIVEAIQEYLKSLEDDYNKVIQEGDIKIQTLKKENHKLYLEAFNISKARKTDKSEIAMLKSSVEMVQKERNTLRNKIKDLEIKIENLNNDH